MNLSDCLRATGAYQQESLQCRSIVQCWDKNEVWTTNMKCLTYVNLHELKFYGTEICGPLRQQNFRRWESLNSFMGETRKVFTEDSKILCLSCELFFNESVCGSNKNVKLWCLAQRKKFNSECSLLRIHFTHIESADLMLMPSVMLGRMSGLELICLTVWSATSALCTPYCSLHAEITINQHPPAKHR